MYSIASYSYMVYSEQELSALEIVIPLTTASSFNFGKKAEQDEPNYT